MSQPHWISLYTPAGTGAEALKTALASALTDAGASAYDPFGTMPGLSYPRAVKMFIAPQAGTWLRLICAPDVAINSLLPALPLALDVRIDGDLVPSVAVYAAGQPADTLESLTPYLTDTAAFSAHLAAPRQGASGVGGVPTGALPANIRSMSSGLPTRQVNRMMSAMTGSIGSGDRAGAEAILRSVDWDSGAGAWMRELLAHLGLSPLPDYATVSTAYRTARRLARNPKATLYPGDAESREAIPDALDYLPVFYGWKT